MRRSLACRHCLVALVAQCLAMVLRAVVRNVCEAVLEAGVSFECAFRQLACKACACCRVSHGAPLQARAISHTVPCESSPPDQHCVRIGSSKLCGSEADCISDRSTSSPPSVLVRSTSLLVGVKLEDISYRLWSTPFWPAFLQQDALTALPSHAV